MQCAISGQAPETPVVSKKSGHVYEKRLIIKYIDAEGKCPATGEELTADDLLEVQSDKAVKPRPVEAASIPGQLAMMQNEWDDLMLETFTLKQHLDQTRQDLSQALYQNDAACRVIARLVRERDEARVQMQTQRTALAQAQAAAPAAAAAAVEEMQTEEGGEEGISAAVHQQMQAKWKELSKKRKKRAMPDDLASAETVSAWTQVSSNTLHKTSPKGITCLDLHPSKPNLVLTGGVDKTAIVFDRDTQAQVTTLSGHTKRVTDACFHPTKDLLLTSSVDKTARVWQAEEEGGGYKVAHVLDDHDGEVVGATVHATGDFVATASKDKSWAFYDINRGRLLRHVKNEEYADGYNCVRFHPDGLILGTGTGDALVRIWDMKQAANVANFKGHEGGVNALAFSENGYYMASAGEDGFARLWDLRKLTNFDNLSVGDGGAAHSVAFDFSGSYLAAGGKKCTKVFAVKTWGELASYDGYGGSVTGVKFGKSASFLATSSMDRTLRFYGTA